MSDEQDPEEEIVSDAPTEDDYLTIPLVGIPYEGAIYSLEQKEGVDVWYKNDTECDISVVPERARIRLEDLQLIEEERIRASLIIGEEVVEES